MSVYDAHPLVFGECTNIRLIEVSHEATTDCATPIKCRLIVVPFERAPKFTALSYVWGPEQPCKTIYVDGCEFAVRQNLWDFLAQYRLNGCRDFLWIDALCIDQNSIKERNHQVALMRHIYAGADLVLSWLGRDVDKDFHTVVNYFTTRGPVSRYQCRQNEYMEIMSRLARVLRNEYWERLWVVQEFVLGRNLELWSGSTKMSGQSFTEMVVSQKATERYSYGNGILGYTTAEGLVLYRDLYHLYSSQTSSRKLPSMQLFESFGDSKCADIRDRVYGLLGLVSPQELEQYPIPIDYSQSPFELFEQLWERHLRQIGDFRHSSYGPRESPEEIAKRLRTMLNIPKDEWKRSKAYADIHKRQEKTETRTRVLNT